MLMILMCPDFNPRVGQTIKACRYRMQDDDEDIFKHRSIESWDRCIDAGGDDWAANRVMDAYPYLNSEESMIVVDLAWKGDKMAQVCVIEAIIEQEWAYETKAIEIDGVIYARATGINAEPDLSSCSCGTPIYFEGVYRGENLMRDGIVVTPTCIISEEEYNKQSEKQMVELDQIEFCGETVDKYVYQEFHEFIEQYKAGVPASEIKMQKSDEVHKIMYHVDAIERDSMIPIEVKRDGAGDLVLVDGCHRIAATLALGRWEINYIINDGSENK